MVMEKDVVGRNIKIRRIEKKKKWKANTCLITKRV